MAETVNVKQDFSDNGQQQDKSIDKIVEMKDDIKKELKRLK